MPTFLVDESVGRSVHLALVRAGEKSETIIDRHGRGTHDEVWLPDAGANRLLVITADDRQRTKEIQKRLIIENRVLYFCLAPDQIFKLEAKVSAILKAVPEMKRIASLPSSAHGVVARIHLDGHITKLALER